MGAAYGRRRDALALGIVLAVMLLAGRPCAFALNPALDVGQYAHTAWPVRGCLSKGTIVAIAQTQDGHLLAGYGIRLASIRWCPHVPWGPPSDQHLPNSAVR